MPKILLVDDDRSMTNLLKTLLELEPDDFQVKVCPMGSEAIAYAENNPLDIIMVDYHLKDMNGVDLVHHFRGHARFARTPIIMASGLDVQGQAEAAGVDLFLLKPFEPGEIPNILLGLIGR